MRAADRAAAELHGRGDDALRSQLSEQHAHGQHIRDRIELPDLVEVDLLHRASVRGALRLRQQAVDRERVALRFLRRVRRVQDGLNVRQMAMVAVGMRRRLLPLLFPGDLHDRAGPGDAAALRALTSGADLRQARGVEAAQKSLRIGVQFQQRRGEHIPRRAHGAIEIECFHARTSLGFFYFLP